jgi:glutathione S-transferase
MIKLYGVPGSRAMRCLWMLEELGVPYENVKTAFGTDSRQPDYMKTINPNGHIPALQDSDVTLWESLAINLYLARKYDKGLWPKTVAGEGHTFKWSIWAMTEAEEPVVTALLHRTFYPEDQRDAAKAADAARRFETPLQVLDGELGGKSYLVGNDFSVADLNVASVIAWAPLGGISLSNAGNVSGWMKRCTARPAYAKVMGMMG